MSDQYKMRPIEDLEPHYSRHVAAMTRENLHAKSDIAAELACRDWEIKRLTAEVTGLRGLVRAVASETSIPMEEIEQSIAAFSKE